METFITETNTPNYKYAATMRAFLATSFQIRTVDDYVQWVGNWKIIHNQLVRDIQHMRRLKNLAKIAKNGLAGNYWYAKKALGKYAHQMYIARNENKAALHAGQYIELETAA